MAKMQEKDTQYNAPETNASQGNILLSRVVLVAILASSCTLILVIGTFNYMDTPVPEGLVDVWKFRLFDAFILTSHKVVMFFKMCGVTDGTDWFAQKLVEITLNLLVHGHPFGYGSDPALNVYNTKFNDVEVRVYEPKELKSNKRPALVYIHGGGWTWTEPENYDQAAMEYAKRVNMVVFSIRYRRFQSHPHPAAFEDCLSVVNYIFDHAATLGIDPTRIGLGGDSAGGHLTAAVSLHLKKKLRFQIILNPCLQAFDFRLPAYMENKVYLSSMLSEIAMIQFWIDYGNFSSDHMEKFRNNQHTSAALKSSKYSNYLSSEFYINDYIRNKSLIDIEAPSGGDEELSQSIENTILDKRFSPLMADESDLKSQPKTYILTMGYDVLRDDGIIYSQRLRKAGVDVHLSHFPEGFHASFLFFRGPMKFEVSVRINEDIINFMKNNI